MMQIRKRAPTARIEYHQLLVSVWSSSTFRDWIWDSLSSVRKSEAVS